MGVPVNVYSTPAVVIWLSFKDGKSQNRSIYLTSSPEGFELFWASSRILTIREMLSQDHARRDHRDRDGRADAAHERSRARAGR